MFNRPFKSSLRALEVDQLLIFLSIDFPQLSLQHLEMFRPLPVLPPFSVPAAWRNLICQKGHTLDPAEKVLHLYHLPRSLKMMKGKDLQDTP